MFELAWRVCEVMSGLTNLNARLSHHGGANQQERMIEDKLKSFLKSLHYSYQAETIELADSRRFRCLINPNKLSMDLDDKMLSIPFEDICLNGEQTEKETIGVKAGDVISWIHKDGETHWMIYLRYLQEKAYFRGLMRQCDEQVVINGQSYWIYLKGPEEKGIDWIKSGHNIFNDLNYTLEMYISKTPETNEFFDRFKIVEIQGKPWEVQAVDRLGTDGIICVYLKEHYTNAYAPDPIEEVEAQPMMASLFRRTSAMEPNIQGPAEVHPFDIVTYTVHNATPGAWTLSNKRARILKSSENSVEIEIVSGKSGELDLIYGDDNDNVVYNIKILSL